MKKDRETALKMVPKQLSVVMVTYNMTWLAVTSIVSISVVEDVVKNLLKGIGLSQITILVLKSKSVSP